MKIVHTKLSGCFIIEPKVFDDERGYFYESFNQKLFENELGSKISFVQDNQSRSCYGVLRGLHFQTGEHAQAKLVRVITGEALDVAVDIRKESPTFGQHVAIRLSADNKHQLFVPRGFAHGFVVLSESCDLLYKCDNYYNKASESGIIHNDPTLGIDWLVSNEDLIISEKDQQLKYLAQTTLS
jgi:dTDP-4-dehydrorhamnose 3,5-epimerase